MALFWGDQYLQLTGGLICSRANKRVTLEKHCYLSKRNREVKNAKSQKLAKFDAIATGRKYAQPYDKARLLFDRAHSYREWNIVSQCDVPGFFYLESRLRLNPGEQPAIYTEFELCLHESQFERV
jgi:hypothetical protein